MIPSNPSCAAAFATTISSADRLVATQPSLDLLTMADRHAVHRNLHVVAAGMRPAAEGGGAAPPQTFMFDVHNPSRRQATYQLLFRASTEPFDLSFVTGGESALGNEGARITETTFETVRIDALDEDAQRQWVEWREALARRIDESRERVRTLDRIKRDSNRWAMYRLALDFDRVFATGGKSEADLTVSIPAGQWLTVVATWRPPVDAKPGWAAELEVVQRQGKRVLGGSTYALRVVEPPAD